MSWTAPTYHSHNHLTERQQLRCPCCNRLVWSDMLVRVVHLPVSVRNGYEYACDSCLDRWFREGRIERGDAFRRLGASTSHCNKVRAQERRAHERSE